MSTTSMAFSQIHFLRLTQFMHATLQLYTILDTQELSVVHIH